MLHEIDKPVNKPIHLPVTPGITPEYLPLIMQHPQGKEKIRNLPLFEESQDIHTPASSTPNKREIPISTNTCIRLTVYT